MYNESDRAFVERRRPNAFGEKPVLKLMFAALIRAAESWRGLRFTEFEQHQLDAMRKDLGAEYETLSPYRTGHPSRAFPANPRLDLSREDNSFGELFLRNGPTFIAYTNAPASATEYDIVV